MENNNDFKKGDKAPERDGREPGMIIDMEALQQFMAYAFDKHQFRYNEITSRTEIDGKPMTDRDVNTLFINAKKAGIKITKANVEYILNSDYVESYHPIKEFLENQEVEKKTESIEQLVNSIGSNTYPHEFLQKLITKWLVGTVASLYDGNINLLLLLLTGAKNTGKTEFFRRLLPLELKDYFADNKLDQGKDSDILMTIRWIILDDEYGGKSKRDINRLKELLSKKEVTVRLPYGRHPVTRKRIASLCGTTNETNLLYDHNGNRRIIPVEVLSRNFDLYDSIDKAALWREVYQLYKSGYDWELSKEDIETLSLYSGKFENHSSEYELVSKYFIPFDPANYQEKERKPMTSTEILEFLKVRHKTINLTAYRLRKALKQLGFGENGLTYENGIRGRYYQMVQVYENAPLSNLPKSIY